jgi:hypothetical protein
MILCFCHRLERLLKDKEAVGVVSGFMFLKNDCSAARVEDFEEALVEWLEWIQQNPVGIIPLTIDLWAEFGVQRSMRRGATMETLNAGINGPTIDTNNVRRKVESSKGKMSRFSMRQRYTRIFQDLKIKLKFSLGIWDETKGAFKDTVICYCTVLCYWRAFGFTVLRAQDKGTGKRFVLWFRQVLRV